MQLFKTDIMKQTANQRLKLFRERAGLRQEAIAAELDLSLSLLQKVESGAKEVSDKMAEALYKRYQLPITWLMEGKGEMTYSLELQNPYRDYAIQHLEKEVSFLRDLLKGFTQKPNFLPGLNLSGLQKRRQLRPKAA